MDKMGAEILKTIVGPTGQTKIIPKQVFIEETNTTVSLDGNANRINHGPTLVPLPNIPRPPNWTEGNSPPLYNTVAPQETELNKEVEIFVDANDQGSNGGYDSEMEFVAETPSFV
jgi:hypothetical protein